MKKRMLSVLLAFALLCTMLPQLAFFANATFYSGSCGAQGDNLTWTLDTETGLLTIEGSGGMADWNPINPLPPWYYSRSLIKSISISNDTFNIGSYAFYECVNLSSAVLPDSITSIGSSAFGSCSNLTNITVPAGVKVIGRNAFSSCSSLTSVFIPNSVTTIGSSAFSYCTELKKVTIPASVNNVAELSGVFGMFYGCVNLGAIIVDADNPCYSSDSCGVVFNKNRTELLCCPPGYKGAYSVPNSVLNIEECAFYDCNDLTEIVIGSGVSEIGNNAFNGCVALVQVIVPDNVKTIGYGAFQNCTGLQTVSLSDGITYIDASTFRNCSSLTKVSIENSVLQIGEEAFEGCTNLVDIIIPDGLRILGSLSFRSCSALTDVTIPDSVTQINSNAFAYCNNLTNIVILNPSCLIKGGNSTLGVPGTTTIFGYSDSTAQTYAEEYGYTFAALDGEPSGDPILSDEITHLIFSDLAYRHINSKYVGRTVSEWQADITQEIDEEAEKLSTDPNYEPKLDHNSFNELNGQLYDSDSLRVIDVLGMVGDWVIKEVIHGDNGYAAAVFQKGNDIIIAYRGSEGDIIKSVQDGEDWSVDLGFALFDYLDEGQFRDALETYYKYADQGNVTLTGHSLGGALVTYVSIVTGAEGYSFDGAAGHVVDLTYLFEPLRIDFSSKNNMTFTNYTDPPGASTLGADLIQHTNADLFPGVCYKTNPNAAKNGYPEFFWTHQRFSNTKLSEDGKAIEFMPVAETHSPKAKWYASVDYEYLGILEGAAVGALGGLPSGLAGGVIGAGVGRLVKKGNVILGDTGDDNLSVLSFISNPLDYTAVVTRNVIYGGDGKDVLYGAAGSDVLAPGELKGDLLCGGLGNDDYILDCKNGGEVYISDSSGSDRIILNGVDTVYSFENEGSTADGKWEIYCANSVLRIYVQKTIFSHKFSIIDVSGASYGTVDSKRITTRRGEPEAEADKESKEILVLGDAHIVIYDESRTVVSEISTSDYGLRSEEYGTVYAANDGEQNYLSATIYENYSIEVIGDSVVDVLIVGTDSNGNVKKTTQAKGIDLQWADAEIDSAKQTVTQNGVSAVTCVTDKTVGVSIRQTLQELSVDETATLSATAFFEDGSQSTDVYWVSSDASVVRCDYDEGGECIISAVEVGNATIYAIASDSGCFASCELQVKSNTLVPCDGGENCPGNVFTDMPPKGNWAHDAIDWAIVTGVTSGTSETTFSPNVGCTRAQVVTFLWRAAGSPEPTSTNNPFTDVTGGYYYKAVLWAVEKNITSGTSATSFSPNSTCTRAQIVTFLWRFEGEPASTTTNNPFSDVKAGAYYEKAVLWASETGVTAGTSATTFSPDATCTRAQVVTFLYRDMEW